MDVNRTEEARWREHEACTHAAVGFKERSWWRELNKRDSHLKMCLPGALGKERAFTGWGSSNAWMPDLPPKGRQKKAVPGSLGPIPIPSPHAFAHRLLS